MRVLIIGYGSIAKKHVSALFELEKECEIFALRSSGNSDEFEGIINVYDLTDIPAKLDFIIISNPTYLHYKYIAFFADKNIPLFIEKPIVHETKGLNELLTRLNTEQTFTYVACNLRFHPCLQYVKRFFAENERNYINEVNSYCGSYLPEWRSDIDFRKNYSANSSMGGGVHLDLFHEIDYIAWIFGLPRRCSVIKSNKSSLGIDAVDYANYSLTYETFTANIILNYYRKVPKRTLEIIFDEEVWLVDLIGNQITNAKNEIIFADKNFAIKDTYKSQLAYFMEKIKKEERIMNSIQESAEILTICLTDE